MGQESKDSQQSPPTERMGMQPTTQHPMGEVLETKGGDEGNTIGDPRDVE